MLMGFCWWGCSLVATGMEEWPTLEEVLKPDLSSSSVEESVVLEMLLVGLEVLVWDMVDEERGVKVTEGEMVVDGEESGRETKGRKGDGSGSDV